MRRWQGKYVLGAAVLGLMALAVPAANASLSVLYSSGFNSPTYSDGAVVNTGNATDTTTPGQDGWLSTSAGTTNNIPVTNSATDGFVTMTTSGQDIRHPLSGSVTSGSVYLDADFSVSAAQVTGDYFIHLGDGSTTIFNGRTYVKSSGSGYVMALGTGAGTAVTYGSTILPFNTVEHLLVRYDFVAGLANDTGALYINPTTSDGSGDTPYVAATTIGTDATSIAGVYLRQGSATAAATLAEVDNIAVRGDVPEPAALGLLAAAIGAFAFRRPGSKKQVQ